MTIRVNHDISIVTVFDVKQIGVETVAGQTFNEVFLRLLELISEKFLIESFKGPVLLLGKALFQLIN